MISGRRRAVLPALGLLLVVVALAATALGSVRIPVSEILTLLVHPGAAASESHHAVLFAIRLPRILLGALVGAGLGVSGASLQGLFRNPLVDPTLLGLSAGAVLFAVATIVLGARLAHGISPAVAPFVLPVAAFVGALVAMIVVQRLSIVDGRSSIAALLLTGIAITSLASALTGLLVYTADDVQLRTIQFWTLGSLGGATWRALAALTLFVLPPLLYMAFRTGRQMNTLLLGDAEAGHLGTDVERTKRTVLVLVTFVVGAAVAMTGVVGFVGLVVPHALRLAVGADHRVLLPASALLGAALVVGADTVARTAVSPAELPLGVVTALIGTPFFLLLLVRERRRLL